MNEATVLLNALSAIAAFAAAALWYVSATAQVPASDKPDESGFIPASIRANGADFIASALAQQKWSRRGAYAAAAAALCQGIALALSAYAAT